MMADRITRILKYVILGLAAALIVLMVFFVHQYLALRRARLVTARELWTSVFIRRHGGLPTPQEAALISPWMTFKYVSDAYLLPADYLKTDLHITDTRYPMLTLGAYAKESGIAVPTFTANVQGIVRDYLIAHPAATITPSLE